MISVVLVDYNTGSRCAKYINDFCSSVKGHDISFVVIDNSPCEDNFIIFRNQMETCGFIEKKTNYYAELQRNNITVIYLWDGKNIGFAKANNKGANVANNAFDPKYIIFSNSDIILPNTLQIDVLIKNFENPRIGMVGPKVVGTDGANQSPCRKLSIWQKHIIPNFLWPLNLFLPFTKKIDKDLLNDAEMGTVYRIIGAFLIVRKSAFFEVNGFDENTFLYAEEPILSERFLNKGYMTFYDDRVTIIHEQGLSTRDKKKSNLENLIVKKKRIYESERYYYKTYLGVSSTTLFISKLFFNLFLLKLKVVSFMLRGGKE